MEMWGGVGFFLVFYQNLLQKLYPPKKKNKTQTTLYRAFPPFLSELQLLFMWNFELWVWNTIEKL